MLLDHNGRALRRVIGFLRAYEVVATTPAAGVELVDCIGSNSVECEAEEIEDAETLDARRACCAYWPHGYTFTEETRESWHRQETRESFDKTGGLI